MHYKAVNGWRIEKYRNRIEFTSYQKGVHFGHAEVRQRRKRTWPHGYERTAVCHSCALFPGHPPGTGKLPSSLAGSCKIINIFVTSKENVISY